MITTWYTLLFSEIWKKNTHADCKFSKHPNLQTNLNPDGWHVKREDHHPMWFFWLRIIYRSKKTTTQHWLAFTFDCEFGVTKNPFQSKPKTSNSVKSVLEIHVWRIGYHKTPGIFGYPFWPLEYNPECRVFAYSNIHFSFCARAGANKAQWVLTKWRESIQVGLIRNNKPNFLHFSRDCAESTWLVAMKVLYMMPVDYRSYLVGSGFQRIYFLFF